MMRALRYRRFALDALHSLDNMHSGERTLGGDDRRRILARLPDHRLADLERDLEIALADAPGPAMAGAALDDGNPRLRQEAQHLGRLLPHVLCPGMASDVQRDAAGQCRKPGRQT